ncbi:MAG: polyprenyl synthetase family protein [Pseudomonadota bacterium]
MDLKTYLDEKRTLVNDALERLFPDSEGPAGELLRAMKYSVFAGGKRLRPILCIAGAEAVGGDAEKALPIACALELIHTYSLIHDDLPVMDDDDLRRGKATSHKVFGEALALLAGDGLLTEAFHLMTGKGSTDRIPPGPVLRVIHMIAEAAGHRGMVGGQVVDIQSEGRDVDFALVEFIHRHKTGALIAVSVTSGAVVGGGSEKDIEAMALYGQKTGLAFQIADDILDVEGDAREMGKGVGGDAQKKKMTYPSVIGLQESKKIQKEMAEQAIESLKPYGREADPLRAIARYIIERKK